MIWKTIFVTMVLLSLSYKTSLTTKPEKETIIQYKDESYLLYQPTNLINKC